MKNSLRIGALAVCLFSFLLSRSQDRSTWYAFNQYGEKQKITELQKVILYEEVKEEESPYPARIDTVHIEKRLNDSIYVIRKQNRSDEFALMVNTEIVAGAIKAVGIYYPSESVQAVATSFNQKGLPTWKELTTRWVFSEEKTQSIEQSPGYDQVTREAMLEALTMREALSPLLKSYLKANPDTKPFRLYRFVEVQAQHKFIAFGYNPFKQVPYNFEKQFEGDEEVIKLLTTPVSYD